jgi:hypothetical protein
MKSILNAIDEYYSNAFSPEILYAFNFIEDSKGAAEIIAKHLKFGGEYSKSLSFQEKKFQLNLFYIQKKFEESLSGLKLKYNHYLFIDGIDIRPGSIPYSDYLECVKGLANAIWNLNSDFFSRIKDSKGRFKVVLLLRPDIFLSLGLQNATNKLRDNSVFLDWRTTYPEYRDSDLFFLVDRLLSAQQKERLSKGKAWDYYFPWKSNSTNPKIRDYDPSFLKFLQLSYSRPRDIIMMLKLLQGIFIQKNYNDNLVFQESDFDGNEFQNQYSEYLMGGIRDQLSFYYTNDDYAFHIDITLPSVNMIPLYDDMFSENFDLYMLGSRSLFVSA